MNKNVVWVNRFGPVLASYRYRAEIPAQEVCKHNGFKTAINNGEADIVVYSKPWQEDLENAEKAKSEGAKIVVDFCDDHFQDPMYHEFAKLADAIVCPTNAMRARIYDYTKRDSVAIGDPYEQPECKPHADSETLNYLWFGHMGNLKDILDVSHILDGRRLRVVSGPQQIPSVIPWSPDNMRDAFAVSNIALFPTKPGAEYKSPNRLINSIRAGLFPICMTHPSYLEFKHFAWVGNFPTGLKWVDAFNGELNDLVLAGQDYIRDRYSPETIGKQWASFLEGV